MLIGIINISYHNLYDSYTMSFVNFVCVSSHWLPVMHYSWQKRLLVCFEKLGHWVFLPIFRGILNAQKSQVDYINSQLLKSDYFWHVNVGGVGMKNFVFKILSYY